MEYLVNSAALATLQTNCVVVGIYDNQQLTPLAQTLNTPITDLITVLTERGDIRGKLAEITLLPIINAGTIQRVLVVGLGKQTKLTPKKYRKALLAASKTLKGLAIDKASFILADAKISDDDEQWKTRQIIEVLSDVCHQTDQLKSFHKKTLQLKHVEIICTINQQAASEQGLAEGKAIATAMSLSKNLADLPGNICTPSYLAEQASELAQGKDKVSSHILEEADMEALGMGALLSVSRGSRQPAKLITLEYQGGKSGAKPIVLVGKGLTFDAGGISLKPGAGMDEMKYDMCGGATVLATFFAAVELNLPLNIVALVPSSENLPDGEASKPGDILTSMLGLTIEVLNTDAEGRLILCDTLTYAEKYNPEVVIDLATLTGACLVALGRVASGLLGNDKALCEDINAASETACDSVWQLPLWEEYDEQLKSNFADLANIGGRDAGTITAACFLANFTKDYRWAHLDIAGTAWRSGANKGSTGRPVALLVQYLLNRANDAS